MQSLSKPVPHKLPTAVQKEVARKELLAAHALMRLATIRKKNENGRANSK